MNNLKEVIEKDNDVWGTIKARLLSDPDVKKEYVKLINEEIEKKVGEELRRLRLLSIM